MKPETAAKKLGVLLSETPEDFRSGLVSRSQLNALQEDPPEWLAELRRKGPHPRQVVAAKLGVSTSGLARGGVTDALTTEQIQDLLREPPEWLTRERTVQAGVRADSARTKRTRAGESRS